MATIGNEVTVTRTAFTIAQAREYKRAAAALGASTVLRAQGLWTDELGNEIDLTEFIVPIRGIRTVWIEACVHGAWVNLRPRNEPGQPAEDRPRIQVEVKFTRDF